MKKYSPWMMLGLSLGMSRINITGSLIAFAWFVVFHVKIELEKKK